MTDTIDVNAMSASAVDPASLSPMTLDYWRQKIVNLQNLLNGVDPVYYSLQSAVADLQTVDSPDAADLYQQGLALLDRYESNRQTVASVITGINTVSQTLQSLGISFPNVSGLNGLNASSLMRIGGLLSPAIAVYNMLLNWVFDVHSYAELVKAVVPQELQNDWDSVSKAASDAADAAGSVAQGVFSVAKWVIVAAGVALAWKIYKDLK